MGGKREKPEDIVLKLRQVEVLQGQGKPLADSVRQIGVTVQTYYRWRKEYGGMSRDQLKKLKLLEADSVEKQRIAGAESSDQCGARAPFLSGFTGLLLCRKDLC